MDCSFWVGGFGSRCKTAGEEVLGEIVPAATTTTTTANLMSRAEATEKLAFAAGGERWKDLRRVLDFIVDDLFGKRPRRPSFEM